MGLFSKKPGGTFFGNLLRGVASSATGGMLGNGGNRIEIGQTKTNNELAAESAELSRKIAEQQQQLAQNAANAITNSAALNSNPTATVVGTGSGNIFLWLFGIGALVVVFFKDKIFKKKSF